MLIEPIVADHGFELVDAELTRGRPPWRLRVIVDTEAGDGRVAIDRCAEVSREIGSHLDAADLIPSRYQLEVSSPGFDRVLAREKDFLAARGAEVKLKTRRAVAGRRSFRGELVRFEDGVAALRVDGEYVEIAFADIAKASRVYEFTREDFARSPARSQR